MTAEVRAVTVRPHNQAGSDYELLAGQLHLQAALAAQLPTIRAYVCLAPDLGNLLQEVEQLAGDPRRNPITMAQALKRAGDLLPHPERSGARIPHQSLAELSGLPRAQVTRYLLLLTLPLALRQLLARGDLTFGHGWALCGSRISGDADRQLALARQTIHQSWSVRRLESEISCKPRVSERPNLKQTAPQIPASDLINDPNLSQLANSLTEKTGMPVTIEHRSTGAGRIIFQYFSIDETEGLLRHFPSSE